MSDRPPSSTQDKKSVRTMLLLFALFGVVGILTMHWSVPLGLVVLVAAEGFFFVAYRRFSRASRAAAPRAS
ncbi:MAG TPA: hypothetical protein VLX56_02580 [Nitrososphaerales archaeon]|nr:hypothetical protein [Nitrososphaerales archaeon]